MKFLEILFIGFIFSLGIGQLGAINIGPFANLFVHDLFVASLVIVFLYQRLFLRKKLMLPSISLPIIIFLVWAFIALILGSIKLSLSLQEFIFSFLFLLRLVAYAGILLISFNLIRENKNFLSNILKSFLILGVLISGLGLLQLAFFPNLEDITFFSGWDPHKGRLFSTFLDPNFVGAFLALNLVLALILYKSEYWKRKDFKRLILFGIGFPAVALSFTLSRSAWLLFLAASAILGFFKSKFYWWFAIIFLVATFLLIPRSLGRFAEFVPFFTSGGSFEERVEEIDESSAYARFGSWQRGLSFSLQSPVYGFGFNTLRYASSKFGYFGRVGDLGGRAGAGVDSSILFVLSTTGIIGLLLCLSIFYRIVKDSFRVLRDKSINDERKIFGFLIFSAVVALLVESNFINSLFYPQIILWLFSFLGIFYSLTEDGVTVKKLSDLKNIFSNRATFNKLNSKK